MKHTYCNIIIFLLTLGIALFMQLSCMRKEKDKAMEAETSEQEHFVSQDLRTDNVGSEALKGEQLFYLYERFYPELRNGLTIIKSDTYGDCFHEGEWVSCEGITFTVKNDTPYDIPGKAYSILYKEGYWGNGKMAQEIIPGVDIMRGGTATLKTKELSSSTESESSQLLKISDLSFDEFVSLFHLSEREIEELIKTQEKIVVAKEPLSFCVEGPMDGCATRLSFDNKQGYLLYNSRGKDYEFNQQRDVKFVSYDAGQLVLSVVKDEKETGKLIGTLRNGSYSGQFKNVNGNSSPFSFE